MFNIFLLFFIVALVVILKSSWFKGIIGEMKVNWAIKNGLEPFKYKLLKDVLLPTEDGTTQIDHIIISRFGIFVIETKNFSNWIFSNVGPFWVQIVFKNKYKFQNPVRQNYKHVKAIERILGESEKNIFNTVIFTGDCEFKTDVPKGVMKIRRLIPYVKSFKDAVISYEQVENYVRVIENRRLKNTFKNKIQHIRNVDKIIYEKGYDRPTFEDKVKKNLYKALILFLFSWVCLNFLNQLPMQVSKSINNLVKISPPPIPQVQKYPQEFAPQQPQQRYAKIYTASRRHQPTVAGHQVSKPKIRNHSGNPLYSWKDENGRRAFSNIGFPKDKPYTDGKIEWY